MSEQTYRKSNTILGWCVFAVAALTYFLTIEPTASFWDCGEFVSCAYKLQIGHPPGAPLFLMIGRLFSLLSLGHKEWVAPCINFVSAMASAFTILFLFWSITHIARRIQGEQELSKERSIVIFGSAALGALAYTFSDTFWFSAVEAEVYASSSFFTAIVFWAILKWESEYGQPRANRWLIFIAYMVGLSIGVHLLNLLAIPAIVFVYYFKKYKTTPKGVVLASIAAVGLLGVMQFGVIPGLPALAAAVDFVTVNHFKLPMNMGALAFLVFLFILLFTGIWWSLRAGKVLLNTILLGFAVVLIGYSSYAMIVVRSLAGPSLNENKVDNAYSLLSYLNRDQYGDRPLAYGPYYNAPAISSSPKYRTVAFAGKYITIEDPNPIYKYDDRFCTFFPRMYSSSSSHREAYQNWADIKGEPITVNRDKGNNIIMKPTFMENMLFFVKYQVGQMYFRYLLWNFSGRQNDQEGHGGFTRGNWMTGITVFDQVMLGNQKKISPDERNGKSRNFYFFLPFLFGLMGLFFHHSYDRKYFWVVMLLFFFTGLAIVIYLNQTPYQPRERDYAYAGSFYAFSIWVGLGFYSLYYSLQPYLKQKGRTLSLLIAVLVAIPGLMAFQNWDDHDRSGRYLARDTARNYLSSCAKNAILFTYGDNDTFPLWYVQEVEGYRTDVRVVNINLLSADWYINQLRQRVYESDPVKLTLGEAKIIEGTREAIPVIEKFGAPTDLKDIVRFIGMDKDENKLLLNDGTKMNYSPTRQFKIYVDSAEIANKTLIPRENLHQLTSKVEWNISRDVLMKGDIMMLDIIASNNWERPIYFSSSLPSDNYLGMQKYFLNDGFAFRLVPCEFKSADWRGNMNTTELYEKMLTWKWGNLSKKGVLVDDNSLKTINLMDPFATYSRLAKQLAAEGEIEKAQSVLNTFMAELPPTRILMDCQWVPIIQACLSAKMQEKGEELAMQLTQYYLDSFTYIYSLDPGRLRQMGYEKSIGEKAFTDLIKFLDLNHQENLKSKIMAKIKQFEADCHTLVKIG